MSDLSSEQETRVKGELRSSSCARTTPITRAREKVTVRHRGNLRTTTNGAFRHNARVCTSILCQATASLAMENASGGDCTPRRVGEIVEKR